MNKSEAMYYMAKSKNVNDWNDRRDLVKSKFEGDLKGFLAEIDGHGLINKVLKNPVPENRYLDDSEG